MMMPLPSHIRSNERTKMDHLAWPQHEKLWNFTDWKIYIFFEHLFWGAKTNGFADLHCHERDAGMYGTFNELS